MRICRSQIQFNVPLMTFVNKHSHIQMSNQQWDDLC